MEVQVVTMLWSELYFVVCSVVSSGAAGTVADLEGWAIGVLRLRRESSSTMEEAGVGETSVAVAAAIFSGIEPSRPCEGACGSMVAIV